MNTVKINNGRTKMIAHRGVCGLERENTYPAFIAAGNRSYYGIETDIQVMKDGSFVAMHDDDLWRVSGGASALNIAESTAQDIKDIVLPDLDGSRERKDIRIPMLCDYVSICKKYGKKCILEVKNRFSFEDVERLVEEIRELDYLDNVVFISIEYENCVSLRRLLPDAPVQYLTGQRMDDEVIRMLTSINVDAGIDIDYANPARNKERIDLLHSLGLKVNVCVCDDPRLGEELVELGADFLTTNILE
jgi:glycerophosphoryl diester phosphodiesterase